MRRRQAGDEDGFTSVELAIVAPAVLLLVFACVHVALLFHASNVANDMASAALRVGQQETATGADAQARAMELFAVEGAVRSPVVTVTRTATRITITVRVNSERVLPGLPYTLTRTVAGPVDRFIPESDRP